MSINRKKVFGMVLTPLFICMLISAFNIQRVKAESTTILVPNDYLRIQDAIDAANAGDTILVLGGYYAEAQINITKSLTLLGKGKVIVDGLGKGWWAFRVISNNVVIKGLTVINGGHGVGLWLEHVQGCTIVENVFTKNASITISGRGNTLRKNTVTDSAMGITLAMSSSNVIEQNIIGNNRHFALHLWLSDFNSIRENIVRGNGWTSIYVENSYTNNIRENIIEDNPGGIYIVGDSWHNRIVENKIRNNEHSGIALGSGHHSTIKENEITGNQYGILILRSMQNMVEENKVLGNTCWGISVTHGSDDNTVRENLVLRSGEYDLHWDQWGHGNIWTENEYKTKNW